MGLLDDKSTKEQWQTARDNLVRIEAELKKYSTPSKGAKEEFVPLINPLDNVDIDKIIGEIQNFNKKIRRKFKGSYRAKRSRRTSKNSIPDRLGAISKKRKMR